MRRATAELRRERQRGREEKWRGPWLRAHAQAGNGGRDLRVQDEVLYLNHVHVDDHVCF
jgi:hypothetical protein